MKSLSEKEPKNLVTVFSRLKRLTLLFSALFFLSHLAYAQKIKALNNCADLKAEAIPVSSNSESRSCCFKIFITNNTSFDIKNPNDREAVEVEFSTAAPGYILSSSNVSTNLIQYPANIPPITNTVKYTGKKVLGKLKNIPKGKTEVATFCVQNITKGWLYVSWKNASKTVFCRDTIRLACNSSKPETCCAFGIHLVNFPDNKSIYKKVRVTSAAGNIVSSDPDEWSETRSYPNYVEWSPKNGLDIPYGQAIDNDFVLYLNGNTNMQNLTVDWYDGNGNIKCTHKINIPCNKLFKENENWPLYTSITSINDKGLFAFAVKEEDDGECGMDEIYGKTDGNCNFTTAVSCDVNGKYSITATYTGDVIANSTNKWTLTEAINNTVISTNPSPYNGLAGGEYYLKLDVSVDGKNVCSQPNKTISIPKISTGFIYKLKACRQVDFDASASANNDGDILTYSWQCTPGVSGFPSSGEKISYKFPADETYTILLTIVDKLGCIHTKSQKVIVSKLPCTADFTKMYNFCSCPAGSAFVKVSFNAGSSSGCNPLTYQWDFGDGNTQASTSSATADHVYKPVSCPDGNIYSVKLTISDSEGCTNIITKQVVVKPCSFDIDTIKTCPDGKVYLQAKPTATNSTPYGYWTCSFPGVMLPWPWSDIKKKEWLLINGVAEEKNTHNQVVFQVLTSGNYTFTFTAKTEDDCICVVTKTYFIKVECCTATRFEWENYKFTLSSGKDYKMKCKFSNVNLPLYHRIRGKTKLRVVKKTKILGIVELSYYSSAKADKIEASFSGAVWEFDSNLLHPFSGCNCKIRRAINTGDPDTKDERTNSSKAKFEKWMWGPFRSRENSLTSIHMVKIGSDVITRNLSLGKVCN